MEVNKTDFKKKQQQQNLKTYKQAAGTNKRSEKLVRQGHRHTGIGTGVKVNTETNQRETRQRDGQTRRRKQIIRAELCGYLPYPDSHASQVGLCQGWEVLQPMSRIRKELDLVIGHSH